jgi:proteasome accessory factor B
VSDAVERLLNLALYLADAREPVTAERIRADVAGYPKDQDQAAFLRMFERDKDQLRAAGFLLESDETGAYVLDRAQTFAAPLNLTAEETAAVRTAATAMLSDQSFPYAEDLRLALAKISSGIDTSAVPAAARLADEDPARQGSAVATLSSAASRGKRARFEYTNSYGDSAPHEIEPYGLFLHDGRWYLVGRDTHRDEVRTYAVARLGALSVESARPATPDFERPADFDVRRYVRLPFQYGPAADEFEAELCFDPTTAWRADSIVAGQGELSEAGDGSKVWRVRAASRERLLRFALENGPGIRIVGSPDLLAALREGLEEVVRAHA